MSSDGEQRRSAVSIARQDWFGGRLWTGVGAVVILLVFAVAAVGLYVTEGGRSHQTGSDRPGDSAIASLKAPSGADQAPLTGAPAGTVWRSVDQVALPFSATDGPARVSDGVASGFSRTATGALLALLQTWPRCGWINPASQRAEVQAMTIGPGKADTVAQVPEPQLAIRPQILGFRYLSYSPARAVFDMAVQLTNAADGSSNVRGFEATEIWTGGDWRYYDLATGTAPDAPILPDLTGYISYGGE